MQLLENFRHELRLLVDLEMERSDVKEFADYVLARERTVDDYARQCYQDLYQNFLQDRENGDV